VVLLTHPLEWPHQPENRSTSWAGSIVEHRRRIREEIESSPSLAGVSPEQAVDEAIARIKQIMSE
jgi:hypothetical protein